MQSDTTQALNPEQGNRMVERPLRFATEQISQIKTYYDTVVPADINVFDSPPIYQKLQAPDRQKKVKPPHPEQPEAAARPITDYYDVENELGYLLKYTKSQTPEQQATYIKDNIEGLITEFAFKVPYRRKSYIIQGTNFCYGDVRMIDMLKKTTEVAGEGSRTAMENVGLIKVFQLFESSIRNFGSPIESPLIISPPKEWDYGFVFYYEPEFDRSSKTWFVKLHVLWYPEKRNEISKSKDILYNINPSYQFNSTKEFLENPIFDLTKVPNLAAVMKAVGISKQDVSLSQQYEQIIKNDPLITSGINEYTKTIFKIYNALKNHPNPEKLMKTMFENEIGELRSLITGMYTIGKKLKDQIDQRFSLHDYRQLEYSPTILNPHQFAPDANYMLAIIHQHARQQPALVVGGGSCPSIKRVSTNGFVSSLNAVESIMAGDSVENLMAQNLLSGNEDSDEHGSRKFKCPKCDQINERPRHKLIPHCQHCGADVSC